MKHVNTRKLQGMSFHSKVTDMVTECIMNGLTKLPLSIFIIFVYHCTYFQLYTFVGIKFSSSAVQNLTEQHNQIKSIIKDK